MTRFARSSTATGLVLTPFLLATFLDAMSNNQTLSWTFTFIVLTCIPIIIFLGMTLTILGRKGKNRDRSLVLGFGVPSLIACIWIILVAFQYLR